MVVGGLAVVGLAVVDVVGCGVVVEVVVVVLAVDDVMGAVSVVEISIELGSEKPGDCHDIAGVVVNWRSGQQTPMKLHVKQKGFTELEF